MSRSQRRTSVHVHRGLSFEIATENQEETDRYWNAIVGNGGTESQCGWRQDRWGRAFEAMMTMGKIDIAAIEAARRG